MLVMFAWQAASKSASAGMEIAGKSDGQPGAAGDGPEGLVQNADLPVAFQERRLQVVNLVDVDDARGEQLGPRISPQVLSLKRTTGRDAGARRRESRSRSFAWAER